MKDTLVTENSHLRHFSMKPFLSYPTNVLKEQTGGSIKLTYKNWYVTFSFSLHWTKWRLRSFRVDELLHWKEKLSLMKWRYRMTGGEQGEEIFPTTHRYVILLPFCSLSQTAITTQTETQSDTCIMSVELCGSLGHEGRTNLWKYISHFSPCLMRLLAQQRYSPLLGNIIRKALPSPYPSVANTNSDDNWCLTTLRI